MATALPFPEARKLALICGLFGSDHAGERASAALKAHQIIKAAGLTWLQALGVEPIKGAAEQKAWEQPHWEPPPPPPPAEPGIRDMIATCQDAIDEMTDWEAGFIESIAAQRKRGYRLSEKQRDKLRQIYDRLEEGF